MASISFTPVYPSHPQYCTSIMAGHVVSCRTDILGKMSAWCKNSSKWMNQRCHTLWHISVFPTNLTEQVTAFCLLASFTLWVGFRSFCSLLMLLMLGVLNQKHAAWHCQLLGYTRSTLDLSPKPQEPQEKRLCEKIIYRILTVTWRRSLPF